MNAKDKQFIEGLGAAVSNTAMAYLDAHWQERDRLAPLSLMTVQAMLEATAGAMLALKGFESEEQARATLSFFHAFADDFDAFLIDLDASYSFLPAGASR